jgi:FtsZ-binding cell division protein ZapB
MHADLSIKRLLTRLETLEAEVASLRRENQKLRQENQQLRRDNQHLRDEIARLKKNSSNSSKPPSSDIVAPPKDRRFDRHGAVAAATSWILRAWTRRTMAWSGRFATRCRTAASRREREACAASAGASGPGQ